MGQCFGKRHKKNRVAPSPIDDVDKTLSRGTPFQSSKVAYEDMTKDLAEVQEPKVATGGLAFVVDFTDGDVSKMPPRLASRMDRIATPDRANDKVQYTSEEKELLVELFRDDILDERSKNARRDVKQFDAANRRACKDYVAGQKARLTLDRTEPSITERRQKVKDMAEKARSKVKANADMGSV